MFRCVLKTAHLLRPRLCATLRPSLFKSLSSNVSSKDYLVSSLSLSPQCTEDLKIIKCKPMPIKSTSNADSVVSFFTDYGFSHTQLAKMFSLCPKLLTFDPHVNLKPKLDFLVQRGISGDTLIHIATSDPNFLTRLLKHSLQKRIVPSIDFLQTFFNNNNQQALNWFLLHNRATLMIHHFSKNTPVNVESLRLHGVPDSSIVRLFLLGGGPRRLAQDPEHFSTSLKEIKDMGFDLSGNSFPYAFRVYCGMSKEKWFSKMKALKECFGWTNDQQVLALFMKSSGFMNISEDKLMQRLKVYMKRLGWTPDYMASYSCLLCYNLEKRILPRISVLEILESKGLVKKTSMGSAFMMSEGKFLTVFVNKYQKDIPEIQLMEIYTNTMPNSQFDGSIEVRI